MMTSGKSSPPGVHVARKALSRVGFAQYLKFIIVAVVVVLIVVIVLASTGKKAPRSVKRQAAGRRVGVGLVEPRTARTSRSRDDEVRAAEREKARIARREERRRRREERRRLRLERRRSTRRASRGSYAVKTGTPTLNAIVPQPGGEWVAVVGERQVKPGDQIEGRKIVEVGSDRVKVEYFTKSYEVKLGQPLY